MALKPNAATCWIREQIIEDLPSGLTLRLVATQEGGARLIITGRSLPTGHCELAFDAEGRPLK